MAIKCSLLGHSFTGTDVEEEREEEGSEVVITVKEVEICDRCGERQVVSENKEVTSIAAAEADAEDGDAVDSGDATTDEMEERAEATAGAAPDIDAAEDDAELIGEAEGESGEDADERQAEDEQRDVDSMTHPESAAESTDPVGEVSAAEDDAVILDDDTEERDDGEWPEGDDETADGDADGESADATGTADPTAAEWPDEYGYEEESEGAVDDVAWPEEDSDDGDDGDDGWTPTETFDVDREVEPAGAATITVPEGEFVCPECDFSTLVEESSLRAGDFCPECHRGTLTHRSDEQTRKE